MTTKFENIEKAKNDYTGKASDIVRQLSLAGIAVVWLLKVAGAKPIPPDLMPALGCFVAALGLDLLQYVFSSLIYVIYFNVLDERGHKAEDQIDVPGALNWLGYLFFWSKLVIAVLGWGALFEVVVKQWGVFS